MKVTKLLSFALLILSSYTVKSQSIVGTTPTNKNVVLEEFTGIRCINCPTGDKEALQIYNSNPNRIIWLNNHSGFFATPLNGAPDFRVPFSDYVSNLYSVSGYPSATINRTDFGSGALSYLSDWGTNVSTILSQPAVVNIGSNAAISTNTNGHTLTVDVEAYYTNAGPGLSNRMNVIIIQNNIPGPQDGSTHNPAQVLPNGDYNHKHMVRHNITPLAGDVINTITATSLYSNQYTYLLPTDYNGVTILPADLSVIVFVSEETATGEILNTTTATMTTVLGIDKTQLEDDGSAIHLYPSPANHFITLEYVLADFSNTSISVVNSLGQTIKNLDPQINSTEGSLTININDLNSGIYFINLKSPKTTFTKQFIVNK